MSEPVKIALVGCGGMGRRHLRGLVTLARSSFANVELAAVCDLNRANADFLADEAHELLGHRPAVYADIATIAREMPEIEAASVRQLIARLGAAYPALAPHLAEGVAVAIDGQIYQDALLQEIPPGSDVHILPPIAGG